MPKAVILLIGEFDPPTNAHLRMFEDAKAFLKTRGFNEFEGSMMPLSRGAGTRNSGVQRFGMVEHALHSSNWIIAEASECTKPIPTNYADAYRRFKRGLQISQGFAVKLFLLVGTDVVETFRHYKADGTRLWKTEDLIEIIREGLIVQRFPNTYPEQALQWIPYLEDFSRLVIYLDVPYEVDAVAAARIRENVRIGNSIRHEVPDDVVEYIRDNHLYEN